jgi:CRP/FNR family transcriptional regulator, cyclic AMP receptor protein
MDKRTAAQILRGNSWFAGLAPNLADNILSLGRIQQAKNELLFAAGDEPNGLFAVLSGEVHNSQTSTQGGRGLLLVATAGSWFGEISLFDGLPRFSEAFAVGRCDILRLSVSDFRKLADESTSHFAAFVRLLCEHHRLAMTQIASLRSMPVQARVAQRLIFFATAQREPGKQANIIRLSQEELASVVGISRQALNVHLKRLERDGVLSLSYASVRIHDIGALQRLIKQAI